MRLARWDEIRPDPNVQLLARGETQPGAASRPEGLGPLEFREAQQDAVKRAASGLTTARRRELDVVRG